MKAGNDRVRERVMKAASDRVFSSGVRGWSMDDVAADSGITKRTLYKIIPSKEQLIEAVTIGFIEKVQAGISTIIEGGGDYRSIMEAIVRSQPAFLDSMHSKAIQEVFLEYPAIEEHVHRRRAELTGRLIAFFNTGIEEGFLRGDVAPAFILELFQAIMLHFVRFMRKDGDCAAKIGFAFDCLLHGIVRKAPERAD